ncbi:MAG: hypothetical protein VW683_00295 [Betaproteobacteria bacterium]|jgi:hypothetical protein
MRKIFANLIVATCLVFLTAFRLVTDYSNTAVIQQVDSLRVEYIPETITYSQPSDFELFADAIAQFESNNTYDVVNRFGMMGKYQFSPSTVEFLGYDVTEEEFLNNPVLQDKVFRSYVLSNARQLMDIINNYEGKSHNGVVITTSAVLAGAHFAGATGFRRWFTGKGETVDANGTTLTSYMNRFVDYDLEIVDFISDE